MKRAKFLSLLLTFAMLFSMAVPAFAAEETKPEEPTAETTEASENTAKTFPDVAEHWGKDSVERWAGYGVLNGDQNGAFNPDAQMTRAEFATMLVNLMGYSAKAENTFGDVPADAWFADAILKLAAAGVMKGDGANANPNAPISRQEAAVLLCRAFNIEASKDAKIDFADADGIAEWAENAVAALVERGMIAGVGDNSFAPVANITRASVAKMADNMVAEYVTGDKEITGEVKGLVVVAADATVTLKDAKLSENLIVAPKAGEAEVALTGKTTAGNVYVQSAATVKVDEKAAAGTVLVDAPKAAVEVAGKAESVTTTEAAGEAGIIVAKGASVDSVVLTAEGVKLDVTGTVKDVEVSATAKGAEVAIAKGGKVTTLDATAAVKIDNKGTLSTLKAGADGIVLDGNRPQKMEVASGVETPKDSNGKDVKPQPSGGGGNNSSSGGHTYKYTVSIGSFTGGTVSADVTQTDDNNKDVTLTVTPDEQKGATMPYVLKDLTVKNGDTDVTVTDNGDGTHTFKMETAGTYKVTATFVQPLEKFEIFPVASAEDYEQLHTINATAFPAPPAYELSDYPWIAVHTVRGSDYTNTTVKTADLTITQNGMAPGVNKSFATTEFNTLFTAYMGNAIPSGHENPSGGLDKLGYATLSGDYEVSLSYGGVVCTDSFSFKAEDETVVSVTFKTEDGAVVKEYKNAVAGASVAVPEPAEINGKLFIEWQDKNGDAVTDPTIVVGAEDATYTAHYIDIKNMVVDIRKGKAPEDNDPEANYDAAYEAIGAKVAGSNGKYTVSADFAKLTAVAADPNSTAYKVLENEANSGKLWVGLDYVKPANAASYKIAWDAAGFAGALSKDKRAFVDGHVYDYQMVYSNNDIYTEGQEVFVIWLNAKDKPIEAGYAKISVDIPASYTVKFMDADGTTKLADDQTVARDAKATEPTVPTKDGYVFDKWMNADAAYVFTTPVTSDLTLTATWKAVATFEPMTQAAYEADYSDWAGHPGNVSDFGTFKFTAPDADGKVTVTGTAKYVSGFTGFGDAPIQQGFYYPVMIPVLAEDLPTTPADAQIGTVGVNNDSKITLKSIITAGDQKYYTLLITTANKTAEQLEAYHVSVYWNGDEATKTDYVLDFSGVECVQEGEPAKTELGEMMTLPTGMEITAAKITSVGKTATFEITLGGTVTPGVKDYDNDVFGVETSFLDKEAVVTYAVLDSLESNGRTITQKNPALFLYDPSKMLDDIQGRDSEDTIYKEKGYTAEDDYAFMLVPGKGVTIIAKDSEATLTFEITNAVQYSEVTPGPTE